MKKLILFILTAVVLAPAVASAQQGQGNTLRAQVQADVRASTTPAGLPKLGPAIKNIASTTRAEIQGGASSTIEMVRARVEAIKGLIEKKRGDMKARAEEARTKAKERFGENVEKHVTNISNRLASTSAHLDQIADRIDSRIDTLEDEGYDMSDSIALLATARTDLSAANDKILAVNVALEAAMSTTSPKSQMPAVRAAVKAAEDALKLVKDDLMKAVRSIKVEAGATTTVSQ